jgi:hypothetical protein
LPGAAFDVFGVLLEEPFVGIAFHVGAEAGPLFLVDEINDQAAEFGWVLDFVLGFAENGAEHAGTFAQFFEGVSVMRFEIVAVKFDECVPTEAFRDGTRFVEGRFGLLIGHFEEEQIRQLFHVIAVGETVVAEDVAVVPKLLDKLLRVAHGNAGRGEGVKARKSTPFGSCSNRAICERSI